MASTVQKLDKSISVVQFLLGMVGQDMNLQKLGVTTRLNPYVLGTCLFSLSYASYLAYCFSNMRDIETICEIWILPLTLQYMAMTVNGRVQYQIALQFIQWMRNIYQQRHPNGLIRGHIEKTNENCMKVTTKIVA